ncbi:MAG: hypothetical protein WD232_05425 [Acidimicrobiales bacterium]
MAGERGSGLVSTLAGVTMFLGLLFFAVHLVLNLYGASTVTAIAFDAARIAAGSEGDESSAQVYAEDMLGGYARRGALQLIWSSDADVVRLRIIADHPTADLLPLVDFPFDTTDRTIMVRREVVR